MQKIIELIPFQNCFWAAKAQIFFTKSIIPKSLSSKNKGVFVRSNFCFSICIEYTYLTLLLIFYFFVGLSPCFSQNFKDEELRKFYHLYQYELSNPFDLPNLMPPCVAKSKISEQRMTEIMQAQAIGYDPKLSEVEKLEMDKIQKCLQKEKDKYDAEFLERTKKAGLTPKRYETIKQAFNRDRTLQEKTYQLVKK